MFLTPEILKYMIISPNKKCFIFVKCFCATRCLFFRAHRLLELRIYCSLQTLMSPPASARETAPSLGKWQKTSQCGLESLRLFIHLITKPGLSVVKSGLPPQDVHCTISKFVGLIITLSMRRPFLCGDEAGCVLLLSVCFVLHFISILHLYFNTHPKRFFIKRGRNTLEWFLQMLLRGKNTEPFLQLP